MRKGRRRTFKPVQKEPEFRINKYVRVPYIRLVGDADEMAAISEVAGKTIDPEVYDTRDALYWANELGLDLVEISPKAEPPVCKIIDYQKFLYNRKKKAKELKAKTVKTVIKEIRFGPNTDDHDFDFKLRHAKKFLEENCKVKAYVQFRGRSIVFKDRGELLLLRFIKELEGLGTVENLPKLEGRRMNVMISPTKSKKK